MMNTIFKLSLLLVLVIYTSISSSAQTTFLTLEECYTLAAEHYPVIKQKDLFGKSAEYSISNISKGILPQMTLNAQATYQSEVTSIKVNIPGVNFDAPSKDQYKIYADIAQPITELFTVKDQKDLTTQNAEIQKQNVNIEIYKLRDRINQLFFGILMVDEQLKLNALVDNDLLAGKTRVEAAIKNGVDYKSSLDKIKAEEIKNQQRAIELLSMKNAYIEMLEYFINRQLRERVQLVKPSNLPENTSIHRPELMMFEKKDATYKLQEKIIKNKNIPKVSLFVQAGAGKPSPLNMISNSFSPYYLGGVRANWSLMNLYTQKNEKQLLHIDQQQNSLQKELFLFNTNLVARQQNHELTKLTQLIQTDDELVGLRNSVKNTSNVQLENGIITSTDYIREVNAEDQARQSKLLHQMQLLIAQYNLQNTLGN